MSHMIKKIIIGVALNASALYGVTKLLSDLQYTGGIKFFILGGIVIGVLNTFVKPLMKLLSFPIVLLTAGLFNYVINIIIFWAMVKVVNIVHIGDVTVLVGSVVTYGIAALVFALINWLLHIFVRNS